MDIKNFDPRVYFSRDAQQVCSRQGYRIGKSLEDLGRAKGFPSVSLLCGVILWGGGCL
jgi:hypothetical protein